MTASTSDQIELQFNQLAPDAQLVLLERLVHRLRENLTSPHEHWDAELSAMAADAQIQDELARINTEFDAAESDGLAKGR